MSNPYTSLPDKNFWKPSVSQKNMFNISEIWTPKFDIDPSDNVSTFGSCFAQHIGRALQSNGYRWYAPEEAPLNLSSVDKHKNSYNIFSVRTGNIYTSSLLFQWLRWAFGEAPPESEFSFDNGKFFDLFRPSISEDGFLSEFELIKSRNITIEYLKQCVLNSRFMVFTLGLTESWFNVAGYEYPMCPGTLHGKYNPSSHLFVNQNYDSVFTSLQSSISLMRIHNPNLKFILTVSPVPLTATNTNSHVLVATMHSKSILRAVAGELAALYDFVDYFPSYEIINSPVFRGINFEPNMRNVCNKGVDFVMHHFFEGIRLIHASKAENMNWKNYSNIVSEYCDESFLEFYGKKK